MHYILNFIPFVSFYIRILAIKVYLCATFPYQKSTHKYSIMKRLFSLLVLCLTALMASAGNVHTPDGEDVAPMRRPIDAQHPMWLIHIDCWNYPDPQKIIDLVPEDIRPWVVFNLSLSASHSSETGEFTVSPDGYHICQSWIRVCAENRVWATIQPSSGGYNHFPENDLTIYEEFYQKYPNFIGWNFAEQFWGYNDELGPNRRTATFEQRMGLLTNLLKLAHKYGGYVIDSWCGVYWGASLNPVAMIKRFPDFKAQCQACPEHMIECEKFTSTYGFLDIESTCLGMWLSGYSGHYGQRYDQCGWEGHTEDTAYPTALGTMPMLSHVMFTGQDVVDGPELIWQQDFKEVNQTTVNGWRRRNWEHFPQFDNIPLDLFRKVIDGSVRILNRKEVIDRTKVVFIKNNTSGNDQEMYLSPVDLFKGLYQQESSNTNWLDQKTWTKTTGRYPAIPTVPDLNADSLAKTFEVKVNQTSWKTRWPSEISKRNEFYKLFPRQYTGNAFADHVENAWVIYNPFFTNQRATASIPAQYVSVSNIYFNLARYSTVLMREAADSLNVYFSNYNVHTSNALATDTLRLTGVSGEPTYTWKDRAKHVTSRISAQAVNDSVWQIIVKHNGPLDIAINCPGLYPKDKVATDPIALVAPEAPRQYIDTLQREAESMDWKSVQSMVTNGYYSSTRGYYGQGFCSLGTTIGAALRDTVNIPVAGPWYFTLRYKAPSGKPTGMYIALNGTKKSISLSKSANWSTVTIKLPSVKAGPQEFQILRPEAGSNDVVIDCFTLAPDSSLITTIDQVITDPLPSSSTDRIFDLMGREVSCMERGTLYIIDGKKRIIR